MCLWRTDENYPSVIIKYPAYLFHWYFVKCDDSTRKRHSNLQEQPEQSVEQIRWVFDDNLSHHIRLLDSVLRKLILQTRMRSHPVELDVWFLVGHFVYFHTSCVRTAKALARLCWCAGSPEPSLVAYVISTIISWAGSFRDNFPYFSIKAYVVTTH